MGETGGIVRSGIQSLGPDRLVRILVLPLPCCVILSKCLKGDVPSFHMCEIEAVAYLPYRVVVLSLLLCGTSPVASAASTLGAVYREERERVV